MPCDCSNQITKDYYHALLEMGLRHKTRKVIRRNGSYIYETYHLISKIS